MTSGPASRLVPPLRGDLAVERAGWSETGATRFLVHDRFANRFVAFGSNLARLLQVWRAGDPDTFRRHASRALGQDILPAEIDAVVRFAAAQGWTFDRDPNGAGAPAGIAARFAAFADKAMFFRVPLFRPQKFLDAAMPLVRPLMGRTGGLSFVLAGMLALYLVSRQWDAFLASLPASPSVADAAMIALALAFVKCVHELGHAFFAARHGVRVPVMGVAVMVFLPVLYTDTSEAWRLPDPRRRMWIDAGGVIAEMALAVLATLLWILAEDGPFRTACFSVAAISWVGSLAINLNPFMRFDGYYLLSGLLGTENLQPRSFAFARWRMREFLFGLGERPPETLSSVHSAILIAYAFGAWIYRLGLQIGISLLLYFWLAKVAGVVGLAYTLLRYVAMPVAGEVAQWWKRRAAIASRPRKWATLFISAAALALLALPMPWRIAAPALLVSGQEFRIYPGEDAQLVSHSLISGAETRAGEMLAKFRSPDLESQLRLATLRLEAARLRFKRAPADARDLSVYRVLESGVAEEEASVRALGARIAKLDVRAPFAGMIADVDRELRPGLWLSRERSLAILVRKDGWRLAALAPESALRRLSPGARGRFVADDPLLPALAVRLARISPAPATRFSRPEFSGDNGGRVPVAARRDETGEPAPQGAWFELDLDVIDGEPAAGTTNTIRGLAVLEGRSESLAARFVRRALAVLIREAGF